MTTPGESFGPAAHRDARLDELAHTCIRDLRVAEVALARARAQRIRTLRELRAVAAQLEDEVSDFLDRYDDLLDL